MKKQILSEQFKRMQKLAGLITENQLKENWEEDWNEKAMNNHMSELKQELENLGKNYNEIDINLGWGVDENQLTISSKIYGLNKVFKTMHDENGNIIDYDFYDL
jgi:hypothetical protein